MRVEVVCGFRLGMRETMRSTWSLLGTVWSSGAVSFWLVVDKAGSSLLVLERCQSLRWWRVLTYDGQAGSSGSWRMLARLDPVAAYIDMIALSTVVLITDVVDLLSSAPNSASRSSSSLPFELDIVREVMVIAATGEVSAAAVECRVSSACV